MSKIISLFSSFVSLCKTFILIVIPLLIIKLIQFLRSSYAVKKSQDNFNESHQAFKNEIQELEDSVNKDLGYLDQETKKEK